MYFKFKYFLQDIIRISLVFTFLVNFHFEIVGQTPYSKDDVVWQKVKEAFLDQSLLNLEEFKVSPEHDELSQKDRMRFRVWKSALAYDLTRDNSPHVIEDFEAWLDEQGDLPDELLLELYLIHSSLLNMGIPNHQFYVTIDSLASVVEPLPQHLNLFYAIFSIFQQVQVRDYRGCLSYIMEFLPTIEESYDGDLGLFQLIIDMRRVECLAFTGGAVEALSESHKLKTIADSVFSEGHHWHSVITLLNANLLFLNGQTRETIAVLDELNPHLDTSGYGIVTFLSLQNTLAVARKTIHDAAAFDHYAIVLETFQFLGDTVNSSYCVTLNNLAALYRTYRKYEETINFSERALDCIQNSPELEPVNFLNPYRNHANGLKNSHRFEEAYESVLFALENHRDVHQRIDPELLADHFTIYRVLFMLGRIEEAHAYLEDALRIYYYYVWNVLPRFPEGRQAFFLRRSVYNPDFTWHHKKGYVYQDQGAARSALEMVINFSDLLEHSTRQSLISYRTSDVSVTQEYLSELQSLRAAYSAANMARNQVEKDSLARVIARLGDDFQHSGNIPTFIAADGFREWISAEQFMTQLEDEAVVMYIKSNISETFEGPKKSVYGALVLTPGSDSIVMIKIGSGTEIDSLISSSGIGQESSYIEDRELNRVLYDILWAPVMHHISDVEEVFIRPAGMLHNISFGALMVEDEGGQDLFLIEKLKLRYFSHPHHLMERGTEVAETSFDNGVVLFGNPDFDLSYELNSENKIPVNINSRSFEDGERFSPLPGTDLEIHAIESKLIDAGWNSVVFSGNMASKDNFFTIENIQPSILHISTHGYFDHSMSDDLTGLNSPQDVFVNNGLALSGANTDLERIETGEHIARLNGIITAYEIAALDLSSVDLAVLSACETALGPALLNEGVYGLQRAFRLAGVNKLLGSLWSIPDQQTSEFMIHFYSELLNGKKVNEALRNTQLDFARQYPPFYWAGFILIE